MILFGPEALLFGNFLTILCMVCVCCLSWGFQLGIRGVGGVLRFVGEMYWMSYFAGRQSMPLAFLLCLDLCVVLVK